MRDFIRWGWATIAIGLLVAGLSEYGRQPHAQTNAIAVCDNTPETPVPISLTTDTVVIPASAGKRNYLCGGLLIAGGAEQVSVWEGTGATCGTGSAAIIGSLTEANGVPLTSNGGFTITRPIRGLSTNVDTCVRIAGTTRVVGYFLYAQSAP